MWKKNEGEGTADQPKRRVKQAAALTGNAGLKSEGVVDESEGKMEVAGGGLTRKRAPYSRARAKR